MNAPKAHKIKLFTDSIFRVMNKSSIRQKNLYIQVTLDTCKKDALRQVIHDCNCIGFLVLFSK